MMRPTKSAAQLLMGSSSAPNLHGGNNNTQISKGRPGSGYSGFGRGIPGTSGFRSASGSGTQYEITRNSKSHTAFTLQGLVKHEFGHALGEHGLVWEDTIVMEVKGQALRKGVKPGWKIYMIDNQIMKSSEDIWERFQEAKWQWRSCTVFFVTDKLAIRAEAARAGAAKIQAETERLARLPFDGCNDERHLEQVHEAFRFQGYIDGAEHRAISLSQLQRLMDWSRDHCHRWRDPLTRLKVTIDSMTTYQVNHWVLKPATKKKDCSFTELLTSQKQTPTWFVIQWWGEKLMELLTCIKAHTRLRGLPETTNFWMGAFANRQHSWEEEVEGGFKNSTMYKAMEMAQFRLFMTLDDKTDFKPAATPLSRLWCNYEALMALDEPNCELDIASLYNGRPVILTRGLTASEQDSEVANPGTGYKQKESRERAFSLDIIERALKTVIQHAETTVPEHRDLLLNSLVGKGFDKPPPDDCEQYTKANKRLRALFALTFWRRVVHVSGDDSIKDLQLALTDAIRNDVWREVLNIDLSFMNGAANEKMTLLTRTLPPNLKELTLSLGSMSLADEHIVALGAALPTGVEELDIKLDNNVDISNVGIANFMTNALPRLRRQSLSLATTGVSKEFSDRSGTLDGIRLAIYEEAQRGNLCTTVNLLPNKEVRGRMTYHIERSKCY
mmetsp:Transcript_49928/g.107446  ORF Transcript_49928/g.107446 Transcript_49928/m.107446 type:complete len:670 (-) Transcript_49928:143-2152(-)